MILAPALNPFATSDRPNGLAVMDRGIKVPGWNPLSVPLGFKGACSLLTRWGNSFCIHDRDQGASVLLLYLKTVDLRALSYYAKLYNTIICVSIQSVK